MKRFADPAFALAAALAAPAALAQAPEGLPVGTYAADPAHTIVAFEVDHLGFSTYIAGFDRVRAELDLDPAAPQDAQLRAWIEVPSLDLPTPPDGFAAEMLGPTWFDAAAFPEITFVSQNVTLTGPASADVSGVLSLHGTSAPVVMNVTFNGGWPAQPFDPNGRIGFSATTELSRTAFGMGFGVPPEGSTIGVGDLVRVRIETEFSGPAQP